MPEPRQLLQCTVLFSVFGVKQVFVSNKPTHDKSCEDAFNRPWLVCKILAELFPFINGASATNGWYEDTTLPPVST